MNAPAIAIQVRAAGPLDVAAISALHAACFADGLAGEVWSESAIAQIMAMPGTYGLIVTEEAGAGEASAGFALARVDGGKCEILSLGVAGARRPPGPGLRTCMRDELWGPPDRTRPRRETGATAGPRVRPMNRG